MSGTSIKQEKAKEALYNNLKDAADNIKIEIVKALREIALGAKEPSTTKLLVEIALDARYEMTIRDLAISALGSLGKRARDNLIEALKSSNKVTEAARALSIIGSPAIPDLIEALKDFAISEGPEQALSQIHPYPFNELKEAFEENKSNDEVLKRIISTHKKIGNPALTELSSIVRQPMLSDNVRLSAIESIKDLGKDAKDPLIASQAIDPLIAVVLETSCGTKIRKDALKSLKEVFDPEKAQSKIRAINDMSLNTIDQLKYALNFKEDDPVRADAKAHITRLLEEVGSPKTAIDHLTGMPDFAHKDTHEVEEVLYSVIVRKINNMIEEMQDIIDTKKEAETNEMSLTFQKYTDKINRVVELCEYLKK